MTNKREGAEDEYVETACDLCGSVDAAEIACARIYTGDQPVHVCKTCGLVYVKRRRSAQAIADVWSDEIYSTRSDQSVVNSVSYSSNIPAITARLTFVAEVVQSELELDGKRVCDIGAGEGRFLELIRERTPATELLGIEPSVNNCSLMANAGIPFFQGTIERFLSEKKISTDKKFDVATIMWTLENCFSAKTMLEAANSLLSENGSLVVATGSRILVPFKKPLNYYLGSNPADSHAFRFSANTLQRYLESTGFEIVYCNRFIDHDVLCMIGRKSKRPSVANASGDRYQDVIDFFERWNKETIEHYPS